MASLSPGAQEAMAGVTTIMTPNWKPLTYAVNWTIRDAKHPTIDLAADEAMH